jgi:hypothetical protein
MVLSSFDNNNPLRDQPPSGPERSPFCVLYAGDADLKYIFHTLVLKTFGMNRRIFPIWASNEPEVRMFWTHIRFHCAFLVLNNIVVPCSPNPDKRVRSVVALIPWMRDQSSAAILTFSGWFYHGIKEEALHCGADRFFHLPFPWREVVGFLKERFGKPEGEYEGRA